MQQVLNSSIERKIKVKTISCLNHLICNCCNSKIIKYCSYAPVNPQGLEFDAEHYWSYPAELLVPPSFLLSCAGTSIHMNTNHKTKPGGKQEQSRKMCLILCMESLSVKIKT